MFDSGLSAEEAFYRAFSERDIEAMGMLWSRDDVCCVHPGGPRILDYQAVLESWRQIFSGNPPVLFRTQHRHCITDARLTVHLLEEIICTPEGRQIAPPVIATNGYRLEADGWRMFLHHASVPASLLVEPPSPATGAVH
ncbi:MAG: nuclear transport factor 2 family protein [Pseudomonadota bacterium]